jgi:hypothetical protein
MAAVAATIGIVASACGSDSISVPGAGGTDVVDPPTTTAPTSSSLPSRGWIDGEPNWSASSAAMEDSGGADLAVEATGGSAEYAPSAEPGRSVDDSTEPQPADLRAGSVDDNEDYDGFLAYLDRLQRLGIEGRSLDSTGRTTIMVVGDDGLPVAGIEVVATLEAVGSEPVEVSMRTTADGSVRLQPGFHGSDATSATVRVAGVESSVAVGSSITIEVAQPGGAEAPVPLDVLFLLDATGSMGDEIDRLKQTIDTVASRVAELDPAPDVRFAMTLYRDQGDSFVSSTFDFTGDVVEFQAALATVVADGGGDYPEALDEGLADALAQPTWRDPETAVQLVFLVADAPPQVRRQVEMPYTTSIVEAAARGIKIFPIASSESDDQAELVFRQMAQATGAPFVFLSYGAGGAATGTNTDIASTDYEELSLDELVVRLIAEELADLRGPDAPPVTVPTTAPPATTNPPGQQQPTTTTPGETVEILDILRGFSYYGACGNETVDVAGTVYYPLLPEDLAALDTSRYPTDPAEGAVRVAPPGPGDDVGSMIVYADGIARFESDSGWIIWLTDVEQSYGWEC